MMLRAKLDSMALGVVAGLRNAGVIVWVIRVMMATVMKASRVMMKARVMLRARVKMRARVMMMYRVTEKTFLSLEDGGVTAVCLGRTDSVVETVNTRYVTDVLRIYISKGNLWQSTLIAGYNMRW